MNVVQTLGAIAAALTAIGAVGVVLWRRAVRPGLQRVRVAWSRLAYLIVPDLATVSRNLVDVTRELHELAGSFMASAVADAESREIDRANITGLRSSLLGLSADLDHCHDRIRDLATRVDALERLTAPTLET